MCCAVGFTARAARAAIRAGLDRFAESEFLDDRGEPVIVARLPLGASGPWGPRRIAALLESALAECVEASTAVDPASTALLLLVAERGRPGYSDAWAAACLRACEELVGGPFHVASRVLPLGRAGLGAALREAHALLLARRARHVVVAGADSYLDAHTMNHFLRRGRILSTGRSDGFIPGEGAGALLVELAAPGRPGLHVLGEGSAMEPAHIDSDLPMRGVGLTSAIRAALAAGGLAMSDMHFLMSDLSGESFYFKEAALASTRALDRKVDELPTLHLADNIGETGAAVGPLSLAYLAGAMAQGHAPGTRALLHLAGDGGARAAVIVEHIHA